MFNAKDKVEASEGINKATTVNIIAEGTSIQGNMEVNGDLRISGIVNGNIRCKGKVILAKTGRIEGNVHSEEIDISGYLKGEQRIEKRLILRQSARVNGDVYVKLLQVEEGAEFNGKCIMQAVQSTSEKPTKAST